MSYMSDWLHALWVPENRPDEWLYSNRVRITNLERFAFLIYAKGSRRGIQWGAWAFGEGPWGRAGLSQNEALELIYFYGMRDGIVFIQGKHALEEFQSLVLQETKRVAEEQGYTGDKEDEDG